MLGLNETELKMLITYLEYIEVQQRDASCNDLILENNKDNFEFAQMYNSQVQEREKLQVEAQEIFGLDMDVTRYFIAKLKGELVKK